MRLQILGLNHTTAPVDIREQVIYAGDAIPRALAEIVALPGTVALVFVDGWGRTYVDPLARASVVTREELTRQLASRLGERAARLPRLLGELPTRRVLVRTLLLLKRAWARRQQPRRPRADAGPQRLEFRPRRSRRAGR